jgi:hypothetical protein
VMGDEQEVGTPILAHHSSPITHHFLFNASYNFPCTPPNPPFDMMTT